MIEREVREGGSKRSWVMGKIEYIEMWVGRMEFSEGERKGRGKVFKFGIWDV